MKSKGGKGEKKKKKNKGEKGGGGPLGGEKGKEKVYSWQQLFILLSLFRLIACRLCRGRGRGKGKGKGRRGKGSFGGKRKGRKEGRGWGPRMMVINSSSIAFALYPLLETRWIEEKERKERKRERFGKKKGRKSCFPFFE